MRRPLEQIRLLCLTRNCPMIVAGDVFHKWNSPPELINFAIHHLSSFSKHRNYSIPGQHDLPNHRYDAMGKSAYGTLVRANTIHDLKPNGTSYVINSDMNVSAFPWGHNAPAPTKKHGTGLNVAVVHDYCWDKGHCFPGAPPEKHWKRHLEKLKGYDASFFGDNHIGFVKPKAGLVNCGGLMRRNVDQIDYRPAVYLLHKSGSITTVKLDVSQDKTLDHKEAQTKKEESQNLLKFIRAMGSLEEVNEDFVQSCVWYMRKQKTDPIVQKMVLESLEGK